MRISDWSSDVCSSDLVTAAGASLSETSLDQLLAQGARLRAERDGLLAIAFPPALANRSDASARRAMAGEQRLFDLRRTALTGEQAQLAERIQQFQQQHNRKITRQKSSH